MNHCGVKTLLGVAWLLSASLALAAETDVRVAAWNVMQGRLATPDQAAAALRPVAPDVVLFSEAPGGDWTARVGRRLGLRYVYVGHVSSANQRDKYKSILSRTPLSHAQEFPLRWGDDWNPASAVRATTRIHGVAVALYVVHLAHANSKRGHLDELTTRVLPRERLSRVIVGGDFNHVPGDPALVRFERSGFRSAWKDLGLLGQGVSSTVKGTMLIDHVFYSRASGAEAVRGGILILPKPLSDHWPVWAGIRFGTRQQPLSDESATEMRDVVIPRAPHAPWWMAGWTVPTVK